MKILSFSMWVAVSLGFVGATEQTWAQTQEHKTTLKPLVVLVSLDGFKPSYMSQADTPHLLELAQQGAHARGLISAFPSLTFPNHLTLVTGQTPDQHGIVNNTMTDPSTSQRFTLGSREAVENPLWWQEAQPIWVTLRQQGKIASTLFWPGSESPIQGLMPNDWLPYDHGMSHEDRLATLMSWLNRTDEQRPDFATLYFSDVDSAGHAAGPDSQAVKLAVQKVDQSIGKLVEALRDKNLLANTTLVIVSDHGMALAPENQVIQVKHLLAAFPSAKWEWLGATAAVRLNGESAEGVMQILSTLPHVSCWPKLSIPKKFQFGTHRRIPDIVCLSDVGYSISENPEKKGPLGQHGYDPEHPDMHGILIVSGPQIKRIDLGQIKNVEVYGLLKKLLNIQGNQFPENNTLLQEIVK